MAVHSPITPGALPELPLTLSFETRDQLEALVDQLIALLDQADGDTDIEPEPLEASIGYDCCSTVLELDKTDDEPNLGWSEAQSAAGDFEVDGTTWWYADNDCEVDDADN